MPSRRCATFSPFLVALSFVVVALKSALETCTCRTLLNHKNVFKGCSWNFIWLHELAHIKVKRMAFIIHEERAVYLSEFYIATHFSVCVTKLLWKQFVKNDTLVPCRPWYGEGEVWPPRIWCAIGYKGYILDIFCTDVLITTVRYNNGLLDVGQNFVVRFNCIENIVLAQCLPHALSAVLAGSACGDMEGRFSLQKQHSQWRGWVNSMSGISDSVMPLKSSVACSDILYREKEVPQCIILRGSHACELSCECEQCYGDQASRRLLVQLSFNWETKCNLQGHSLLESSSLFQLSLAVYLRSMPRRP